MAMSATERKRRQREREREVARDLFYQPAPIGDYATRPWQEFFPPRSPSYEENLDVFGIKFTGTPLSEPVQKFESEWEDLAPMDGLQRTIGAIGALLDAATELATYVNQYKSEEIAKAIEAETVAGSNLPRGDVEALKASLARLEKLKKVQADLQKPFRRTFPAIRSQWEGSAMKT